MSGLHIAQALTDDERGELVLGLAREHRKTQSWVIQQAIEHVLVSMAQPMVASRVSAGGDLSKKDWLGGRGAATAGLGDGARGDDGLGPMGPVGGER